MQQLKELIKLGNLRNFKLFARKYQSSKTVKMLWGKEVSEPYILCIKIFKFLEENFSETIRCIGLKFSEITEIVMPFQYSEFLFY